MADKAREPIIDVNGLRNYLGGSWVHDGVDMTVYPSEIIAIIGGSGCGKTTLMRSILQLNHPTSGEIKVFNQLLSSCSIHEIKEIQRRCGVMFQHSALFSSLTVLENVMFPLNEFTQLSAQLKKEIALLKITLAGLDVHSAYKYPAELSGGMQKRAALARALALDPELVFLDEPTAGLDPKSAGAFDDLITHLRNSLNLTIVIVTHDLDSLWRITDRVVFLGGGKTLAQLSMTELVEQSNPLIRSYFSGPRGQKTWYHNAPSGKQGQIE